MAIENILVATDFSPCARSALDYALPLAAKQGARVTVLHAWAAPPIATAVDLPALDIPGVPGLTMTEYVHQQADRDLRTLAAELAARGGGPTDTRLLFGDARIVIVDESANYDLVVLGTHGRGGLARLVLGSVADYVVRHAQCPVLTVRRPAAQ